MDIEKIKAYYPNEWTKEMLRALVAKGRITADDYKTITGEAY